MPNTTDPQPRPISDMTQEEIDFEVIRSEVILDRLSKGLPVGGLPPVVLDRIADVLWAPEARS